MREFNVQEVREDFPILKQVVNGHPLVYLDNGATSQKPQQVIDALVSYYTEYNSNVHRGAHYLSDKATAEFEAARETLAKSLNSPTSKQVIWVRGTTEAMNLIAQTYGAANVKAGQKIIVSGLEHHSNIVPWQMLAEKNGAEVLPIPITADGEIDLAAYEAMLDDSVAIVSVAHVSNAMGTINPIKDIIAKAKAVGAATIIDGAQGISHFDVDVQDLGCDFYCFSGHKNFGPTGIGVLWGNLELLEAMPPWHGGGEMIETVRFEGTTYAGLPFKFEAGTPNIADAIALAAAFDYVAQFNRADLVAHEKELEQYCVEKLSEIEGFKRVGNAKNTAAVVSFLIEGLHPSDIGALMDQHGVAVRTGHHCAQPLMHGFDIPGTIRASFSIYNTKAEVDKLAEALNDAISLLR